MFFRVANKNDAKAIATLHAESWRHAYRGILSDDFLDTQVFEERNTFWQQRLESPPDTLYLLLAIEQEKILGFVCVEGNKDEHYGSLVDNLHISPELRGQGIGKMLFEKAAAWTFNQFPQKGLYLWVYEKNTSAQKFYEKMGGQNKERILHLTPDGTQAVLLRYYWQDLGNFIENDKSKTILLD